jgi:hypothetical protein
MSQKIHRKSTSAGKSHTYSKEFLIFSFASEHTVETILLQKKIMMDLNNLLPFLVKSGELQKLKYDILEKQVYALVKELKYFRTYILHYKVIAYAHTSTVK